ncbi:MAG: hypothetical protein ACXVXP_00170 [Mycobacteriaceae bacterium]
MRHHHEPQRARPSLSLGSSGPSPTRTDDGDPSYVAPRVLGFAPLIEVEERRAREVEPLLWDGDQA